MSVTFSEQPSRLEAERAFSVESPVGAIEGDFSWNGPGFTWKPVRQWDPGLRYRLVMQGSIGTADGREARPSIDLPFYAVRSSGLPVLEGYWPSDGESTGVRGDGAAALELRFSETMDTRSVLDAFSLSPRAGFTIVWNAEAWKLFAASKGLDPQQPNHAASKLELLARITSLLDALPRYAQVRAVHLALEPWTIEAGLLTPTLKVKRDVVVPLFAKEIDDLYAKR